MSATMKKLAELGQLRADLRAELEETTDELRLTALQAVAEGQKKRKTAETGQVTRATLYKWMANEQQPPKVSPPQSPEA